MRLTTKGRYAVTAVMDLAIHQESKPVTLSDISMRQGISQSYLGRLFAKMHSRGLVMGHRGPSGGYTLCRAMEDIYLTDVLDAVDEGVDTMRCAGKMNCQGNRQCLTHTVWEKVERKIRGAMAELSVADLINDLSVRQVAARQLCEWRDMNESTAENT